MLQLQERWTQWGEDVVRQIFLGLALLVSLFARPCQADEWTDYIRLLERSSRKVRKDRLPTAYRNYAYTLFEEQPEQAFQYMEKSLAIDSGNEQFKHDYADMLFGQAVRMVNDRQDNDHENREARRLLEKALRYDSQMAKAYELIGDIAYDNQDLHGAKLSWKRANIISPSGTIEKKLDRIQREGNVERSFRRESLAFFDVRYEKSVDPDTARRLRKYLEFAREEVGADFRYYPRHKLVVLVYSQSGFKRIVQGRGPGWWAAFYDGKIRVPVSHGLNEIKPTLLHEYTHAIVHDLSRGYCPKWLNEGMAELQEAKVRRPDLTLLRRAVARGSLIPLSDLNDKIVNSTHMEGALAYQQAFTLATYLEKSFGIPKLRRVLERLSTGESMDNAMTAELGIDSLQLEREWKLWLTKGLAGR